MGIGLDTDGGLTWHGALAALAWQYDLGVTELIGDHPVSAYDQSPEETPREDARAAAPAEPAARAAGRTAPPPATALPAPDAASPPDRAAVQARAVAEAEQAAARAATLADLRAALDGYHHCEIRRGAKNLVFADGIAGARVLILGEAPGRDEDLEGRPFVGRAGQLLDRMLAAIGLSRDTPDPSRAVYITNVMPWRPPQNRDPDRDEIAMMRPFVERHIALADPAVIVVMGNTPCAALLGRTGITAMRGKWATALGRPVLPMFHPAYLLREPELKREAWADLLALQARLKEGA